MICFSPNIIMSPPVLWCLKYKKILHGFSALFHKFNIDLIIPVKYNISGWESQQTEVYENFLIM